MKIFAKVKDGGYESKVTAYFLIEWKRFFSIALLRFDEGSREAYHSHAFNCISWVLRGWLIEQHYRMWGALFHTPSFRPVITKRTTFHKVFGMAPRTWVLTFRGPWAETWSEYLEQEERFVTLTHGRREVPL